MPFHAPAATDERSGLAGFLRQQQDAFRAAAFGLTDEQAGATPTPSALSVGALVKHATGVQQGWLDKVLAAPEPPVDERSLEERMAAHAAEFAWTEHDSLAGALAAYEQVCAAVQDAVATVDLDLGVPVPDAPWSPRDVDSWTVRWVWLHLVEELARHAGHADIIREAVDGATMYELVAAAEGMPETPWLRPWRPAAASA